MEDERGVDDVGCSAVWRLQLEEEEMYIISELEVFVLKAGRVCRLGCVIRRRPGRGGESVLFSTQTGIVNPSEVDENVDGNVDGNVNDEKDDDEVLHVQNGNGGGGGCGEGCGGCSVDEDVRSVDGVGRWW